MHILLSSGYARSFMVYRYFSYSHRSPCFETSFNLFMDC